MQSPRIARLAALPSLPFHSANLQHPPPSSPISVPFARPGHPDSLSPIPLGSLSCDIYDLRNLRNLRTANCESLRTANTANCEHCELRILAKLRTANPLRQLLRKPAKPRSCEITRSCEDGLRESLRNSAKSVESAKRTGAKRVLGVPRQASRKQLSRGTLCSSSLVPFFPPSQQKPRTPPPRSHAALHSSQRPANPLYPLPSGPRLHHGPR